MKKEYLVLIALIVVLSLYLVFKSSDRTNYEIPDLPEIDKGEITKLVFSLGGESVILERADEDWKLRPEGYPADKAAVDRMLEAVEGLELNSLVAQSGNYSMYDLEGGKRIKLEVYEGPDVALSLDIGKNASTHRHTFVRVGSLDGVYQAAGNLRSVFETDRDRLRDKTAMKFDRETVTGLTLVTPEGPVEIARGTSAANPVPAVDSTVVEAVPAWVTADGAEADEQAINGIISSLSNLRCESYVEGRSKEDLGKPVYTVIVKGLETMTLDIYAIEGEKYPATSSQNDYPFYLPKWRGEQIMKLPSDIQAVKEE